jgi:hypothetical protein
VSGHPELTDNQLKAKGVERRQNNRHRGNSFECHLLHHLSMAPILRTKNLWNLVHTKCRFISLFNYKTVNWNQYAQTNIVCSNVMEGI